MRAAAGMLGLAVLLGVLLVLAPRDGAETPAQAAFDRAAMQTGDFSGAVLVARGDRVLFARGYGLADQALGVPNTPRTTFAIGSVTKPFTAAAVLLLQEQGHLRVEDPVCRYLDECPSGWGGITLHHLLSHTAGLAPAGTFRAPGVPSRPGGVNELVGLLRTTPCRCPPVGTFGYSNVGYALLGAVVERAAGQPWDAFLDANVFRPLGMVDTAPDRAGAPARGRAVGYARGVGGGLVDAEAVEASHLDAAGGLRSTIGDLHRWNRALAAGGLLSASSREAMFRPQAQVGGPVWYGYGWFLAPGFDGHPLAYHPGGVEGFAACVRRSPGDDLFVAVLSNLQSQNACGVAQALARAAPP